MDKFTYLCRRGECKRVSKGMRDKEDYWHKNENLIDRLSITGKEQKYMNIIVGVNEKYRKLRMTCKIFGVGDMKYSL